ncbi:MAG: hypothetical protein WAW62_01165 [Candidatus Saccharimonas aalborgensis]
MDIPANLQEKLTTNISDTVNDQLSKIFMQYFLPTIIFMCVIIVLYVMRAIHRYRVDRAIFEIRDTLRAKNISEQQLPQEIPKQSQ